MVAQIEFGGWTGDKMIRHGRFVGLRGEKPANAVVREVPARLRNAETKMGRVNITHGERLIYPEQDISKADMAAYMEKAAPLMMPYIQDRLVSFLRCPEGAGQTCFFQRHKMAGLGEAWLSQEVVTSGDKRKSYMYCKTPESLLQAVQMGVVEFHIWGSRVNNIETPDRIVFDLDPDEGLGFEKVKAAAFRFHDVLAALELRSLPLLSGGKGVHVVVPVTPRHDWEVVKKFSADLARRMAADAPAEFVATMSKAKRRGKIFIDYLRNEKSATAIAPFSPRARVGAAVAWPLTWPALESAAAANMMTIPKAMAALQTGENGWSDYSKIKQQLSAAALRAIAAG